MYDISRVNIVSIREPIYSDRKPIYSELKQYVHHKVERIIWGKFINFENNSDKFIFMIENFLEKSP